MQTYNCAERWFGKNILYIQLLLLESFGEVFCHFTASGISGKTSKQIGDFHSEKSFTSPTWNVKGKELEC